MVNALRAQNPQVDIVLQTMNPAWDSPKTSEKKFGSARPNLAAYYEVYRRYARENNLTLVDNYLNWLKIQKDDPEKFQKMVSDGIHPHGRDVTWPGVEALMEKARTGAATK